MAGEVKEAPEKDAPDQADAEEVQSESFSNWEFVDTIPTVEQVRDLLKTLPPVYGLEYADYVDFVQGLPQTKKITKRVPTQSGGSRKEEEYHDVYTLYMSVAGRVKMLNDAAEKNGWQVNFEPEPGCSPPGMLQMDDRIVYREYVEIWAPIGMPRLVADEGENGRLEVREQISLGRKAGTAWVPSSGGKQAAGSNPYEKVETSARGRAIAAWGIGVLPGSGIASLEEMLGAKANERALQAQGGAYGQGGQQPYEGRKSREEILEMTLTAAEEVRQLRGISEHDMKDKMGTFLSNLGIASVYDEEEHSIDWKKVKDGQIVLMLNSFRDTLRDLKNQEAPL